MGLGAGILVAVTLGGTAEGAPHPASPAGEAKPMAYLEPGRATYLELADEVEAALRRDVLGVWFPRAVDADNGGFRSDGYGWCQPVAGDITESRWRGAIFGAIN